MKSIIFLSFLFFSGCVSKTILFRDVEKIIKVNCNVYADTLNTFGNYYYGSNSLSDEHIVPFYLSSKEQQAIINIVIKNNYFELPDTITRYKHELNEQGQRQVIGSFHDTICEIELNGRKKPVFMGPIKNFDSEESLRFQAVMKVIVEIIERREDLKEFHQGIWNL